jgi:hypothetical protein
LTGSSWKAFIFLRTEKAFEIPNGENNMGAINHITTKENDMKKRFIILAVLINLSIAVNAMAAVNFYKVELETTHDGWITRTSYDQMYHSGSGPYYFTTYVTGEGYVLNSKVWVAKLNPNTPFYDYLWRVGDSGSAFAGTTYYEGGALIYRTYNNPANYEYENCSVARYMTFEYQYIEDGAWTKFIFQAFPGCIV